MRLKVIYNVAFLIFLYALCSILCFSIQDKFDCELQMCIVFPNCWHAIFTMIFIAPILLFLTYKKDINDGEQRKWEEVIYHILMIILMLIVLSQVVGICYRFVAGLLDFVPCILCIGVNILAGICAYLWSNINNKRKLGITTFSIVSILVGSILTQNYCPVSLLRKVQQSIELNSAIDSLNNMHYCSEFTPPTTAEDAINKVKYNQQLVRKYIKNKRLVYEKIDDTHYKISWIPYINKTEMEEMQKKGIVSKYGCRTIGSSENCINVSLEKDKKK